MCLSSQIVTLRIQLRPQDPNGVVVQTDSHSNALRNDVNTEEVM